eukprot:GDKI01049104.1.p1 GENE.GDKI01049104.1~~GDKI01049104.1.p1  ORF type:complete len:297 (+),score=85.61 GDKI01049104.1:106-996(+)
MHSALLCLCVSSLLLSTVFATRGGLRGGDDGPRAPELLLPASWSTSIRLVLPLMMTVPGALEYRVKEEKGKGEKGRMVFKFELQRLFDEMEYGNKEDATLEEWAEENGIEWSVFTYGVDERDEKFAEIMMLKGGKLVTGKEAMEYVQGNADGNLQGVVMMCDVWLDTHTQKGNVGNGKKLTHFIRAFEKGQVSPIETVHEPEFDQYHYFTNGETITLTQDETHTPIATKIAVSYGPGGVSSGPVVGFVCDLVGHESDMMGRFVLIFDGERVKPLLGGTGPSVMTGPKGGVTEVVVV